MCMKVIADAMRSDEKSSRQSVDLEEKRIVSVLWCIQVFRLSVKRMILQKKLKRGQIDKRTSG